LPLADKAQKIALIGSLGNTRERRNYVGNWSMDYKEEDIVTLSEGLKQLYPESEIIYETGCKPYGDCPDSMISQAVVAAQSADVVVLAIGEDGYMSGECASRTDISLPGNQEVLIDALAQTGKPVVAVVFAGRPMVLTPVLDQLDAVLYAWQPGTMGGLAIADLLSGTFNPSAKLTMTFPRHQGQIPIYYNQLPVGRPRLGPEDDRWGVSKWSDELNEPLFPFGFGLSYTQFEYSNLRLSKNAFSLQDSILISVDVENTGSIDGEEIVQLYVRDLVGSVVRPLKELKGFERVMIKKGIKRTLQFVLRATDLAFYNQDMELNTEVGELKIMVGGSSDDYLETSFEIF
jgi:beta-glucosidase